MAVSPWTDVSFPALLLFQKVLPYTGDFTFIWECWGYDETDNFSFFGTAVTPTQLESATSFFLPFADLIWTLPLFLGGDCRQQHMHA